jgi:hypothetical protein
MLPETKFSPVSLLHALAGNELPGVVLMTES